MKKTKLINFKSDDLIVAIQYYADENCEGNFNLAVRELLRARLIK